LIFDVATREKFEYLGRVEWIDGSKLWKQRAVFAEPVTTLV